MEKYLIKGELYDPIKYGDEDEDWTDESGKCGDCGCSIGEQHLEQCDIERFQRCHVQFLSCACGVVYVVDDEDPELVAKYIEKQKQANATLSAQMSQHPKFQSSGRKQELDQV